MKKIKRSIMYFFFFYIFCNDIYFYKVIENFLRSLKANKCTKEIRHFKQTFQTENKVQDEKSFFKIIYIYI